MTSTTGDANVEELVVEITMDDLIEIADDVVTLAPPRRIRWTRELGITTQPQIQVGVMLGAKRER